MSRPTTLPEPWRSLAAELERRWLDTHPGQSCPGGVTLTAEALESSTKAVYQWAHGQRAPRGPARRLIDQLFRDCGLEPPEA